ncbi:MAG: transposase [Desulfobacteraceae bacterium]|nr:transposase [Desulfobacteraceae bacterium]
MPDRQKRFTGESKSKLAVEAIKGQRTLAEIADEYGVHPNQITEGPDLQVFRLESGTSGNPCEHLETDFLVERDGDAHAVRGCAARGRTKPIARFLSE